MTPSPRDSSSRRGHFGVPPKFLRQGIRYDDLTEEEKDAWDILDWGEDGETPDAVSAEELNRFLFNADTVNKVLAELMTQGHKVAAGDRLGKTIIFAKNRDHAQFIAQRFDIQYPEYAGSSPGLSPTGSATPRA